LQLMNLSLYSERRESQDETRMILTPYTQLPDRNGNLFTKKEGRGTKWKCSTGRDIKFISCFERLNLKLND